MKKLLTLFLFVFVGISIYASSTTYYAKLTVGVSDKSTGSGTIYVNTAGNINATGSGSSRSSSVDVSFNKVYATPDSDSYLSGWDKTNIGNVEGTASPYTVKISATSADPNSPTVGTLNAIFDKVVSFSASSPVTIFHTKGSPSEKTIGVKVNNGGTTSLTPSIVSSNADVFQCTTSGSGADWQLIVNVSSTAQEGNTAKIKLTTKEGKSNTIDVQVKEVQIVNFLSSKNGSYTVTQTFNSNEYSAFPVSVQVTSDEEGAFSFVFSPSTNYRFNRVICRYLDGTVKYLYDDNMDNVISTTINNSCTIEPEFLSKDYAQFIALGGDTTIHYSNLNRAIEVVREKGYSNKVISVYNKGGKLQSGEYTLPSGYTLLVPGKLTNSKVDYQYLAIGANPTTTDFATSGAISPSNVCKLVIESGTTLNVHGGLCVYGIGNYSTSTEPKNTESMKPGTYGWVELQDGVVINMKSGSTLHALGYITNDPNTTINPDDFSNSSTGVSVGRIVVESGVDVHEIFKMNDWRGGTVVAGGIDGMMTLASSPNAAVGMIKNSAKVFPICQYYIQNIEAPTVYSFGSKLKLTTITGVGSGSTAVYPIATADFIIPNGTGQIESGMFRIGDQTQVIKYYDSSTDRVKYIVEKTTPTAEESVSTQLHTLVMTLKGKLLVDVSVPVKSSDYVLPITNNMDIVLRNGAYIEVPSTSSVAFLAGTTMSVDATSIFDIKSDVYLYDRDERVFTTTGKDNVDGKGYFGTYNTTIHPLKQRPGGMKYTRTDADLEDVKWMIDGEVTVNGALYTTAGGANITSTGGGKVVFNKVGSETQTTSQAFTNGENAEYYNIPITKAKLHNDESKNPTEPYSAGNDAKEGETYIYIKDEGKWSVPTLAITTWEGNIFNVTLPDEVEQNVVCPVVAEGVTIRNWSFDVQGAGFAKNGEYSYSVDTLKIPVTYTPLNKHNVGSPNNGSLVVTITYDDPVEGSNLKKVVTIPLTATENYTPAFSVEINGTPVADGGEYTMTGFVDKQTVDSVVVKPAAKNVAMLPAAQWNKNVGTPFSFTFGEVNKLTDAKLIYLPSTNTTHTGQLQLTASYTDASSNTISKTYTINLNAVADKSPNDLAFNMNKDTIYQGQSITDVFSKFGNNTNLTFTYNGESSYEEDLISVTKNTSNDNYTIVTKEVEHITDARTITIVATQAEDNAMYGGSASCEIMVLPAAIWNWSNLYFGATYFDPVVPQEDAPWTLELLEDSCGVVALSYDNTLGYQSVIATPIDPTITCTARFRFTQDGYVKEFTSNIYADPRVVSYCVDKERTYKGVTIVANNVTFDDSADEMKFSSSTSQTSSWTVQLVGVPSELSFTPLVSDNAWRIEEYNGIYWTTTYNLDNIPANTEFRHSLQPSTQQIRITYAAGSVSTGVLQNVCVTAIEDVKANTNKVYMPVAKDGSDNVISTTQKVVLYSVVDEDLSISLSTADMELDVTTLTANAGAYNRQEVLITNNGSNISTLQYLYVKKGEETLLTLPIQPFEFRQGLPINSERDDSERYYYLTTASATDTWSNQTSNVRWDSSSKAIVFQNAGSLEAKRSVAFAYEGAADYISFHTSTNVALTEWLFEESVDGVSWADAVDSVKTIINDGRGIKQPLKYTTRYVRITYVTNNLSKVLVSNLNIIGTPHLIVDPLSMTLNDDVEGMGNIGLLTLTTMNLHQIRVLSNDSNNFKIIYDELDYSNQVGEYVASSNDYPHALGKNKVGEIRLGIAWQVINTIDDATITVYDTKNDANPLNDSILAVVDVLGAKGLLTKGNVKTGLYTGIPDGTRDTDGDDIPNAEYKFTFHGADYKEYPYHEVDVTNAFSVEGAAMFDYLFIYGETKPSFGTNITVPQTGSADESTNVGSNAQTPLYVYKKTTNSEGEYIAYQFVGAAESNHFEKAAFEGVVIADDDGTMYIDVQDSLRVYMTGFSPYATTGYTKNQEGVFLFRGKYGSKLDIYLEDCHIISRNKTRNGNTFYGDKEGGDINTDGYTRGSGGVLVFENMETREKLDSVPMSVTIHTRGDNMLKSNHGCFFGLNAFGKIAMKAYQVSSPVHIHMYSKDHARMTKTDLNFDDKWPVSLDENNAITSTIRTNGFLALKKQNNNAPSIDMGNEHTVVNFNGGRVELQNSQIVSDTYKTTLAISHRSGYFGADDAGIQLCYGIGTDSVGGTVNFNDGTVTVEPMKVSAAYQQYYLMDPKIDSNGDTIKVDGKVVISDTTTCLRLPKNTYVYGGSHCFMRACQHVTSKGGAPKDGPTGSFLGQYIYTIQDGDSVNPQGLAVRIQFPQNLTSPNLNDYLTARSRTYYLESVSPDASNKLYFWIPDGYGGVTAERDKFMSIWKACMTEISAGIAGVAEGTIGGDTPIEPNEDVKYFLYCQIDENIHDIISAGEGDGDDKTYNYKAPIEVPTVARPTFGTYMRWAPSYVSDSTQYQVLSDTTYTITDRVYYITNATADIWQTFTAPFDVAKIYVVETYSENALIEYGAQAPEPNDRQEILKEQAKHNADFAAFFAVAMAMGTDKSFEQIYDSYLLWAIAEDKDSTDIWDGNGDYTLRSMQELIPYYGNNWREANFYLNVNKGNWTLTEDEEFEVKWEMLPDTATADGILLHKGFTYSLMFPYCTGCESTLDERTYWDYWSGKFLIFESKAAPQTINGRDFLNETKQGNIFTESPSAGQVVVTGNSTFANIDATGKDVYKYNSFAPDLNNECFEAIGNFEDKIIYPTTAFLYGDVPTSAQGAPARKITRSGKIIYDDGTTTGNQGGHIPTVGGGNDLFITETANGINIAVAEAQVVRVMTSTGAVLYSGMVQTAVNVALPTTGVYVITGENEVHKILY